MFRDARGVPDGDSIQSDLCIVGGGAAGITLALELKDAGVTVTLIEAGGFEPEAEIQDFYAGPVVSDVLSKNYLKTSRLRQFGGTTNHWGGHSVVINEHIYGPRAGVAGGSWPFDADELRPYYVNASRILNKTRIRPQWHPVAEAGLLSMERYAGGSEQDKRLGRVYRDTLEKAPTQILLHGSVTGLNTDSNDTRISEVRVQTLAGNEFTVSSRAFVLATGGIENARLLLLPAPGHNRGIGNHADQVGRYFGDHLFVHDRIIETSSIWGAEKERFLTLLPGLLEEQAVFELGFIRRPPHKVTQRDEDAPFSALAGLMEPGYGPIGGHLIYYVEPLPEAGNRVLLSDQKDPFGHPRSELHYRVSPALEEQFARSVQLLARLAGVHGLGRVSLRDDRRFGPANHHVSTTRMSDDPRQGVADRNGKVHGMMNLFVAGSSLFPSSGCGNPTYPLVALAARLAGHLRDEFHHRRFN